MATISSFEDLEIWREARQLSKEIFIATSQDPWAKDFKFRDQTRASAGSVMDNIAEGFERSGNREFIQFLSISKGSAGEVRSQLYRALDQQYISEENGTMLINAYKSLSMRIAGFIDYLSKTEHRGYKFKKD